jgi:hypothetical protein
LPHHGWPKLTALPVRRSLYARGGLSRSVVQGGVVVSSDSTRSRLLLTDCRSLQLATLIANMVEDHVRTTTSPQQGLSFQQEVCDDREDYTSAPAADGIRLHSSVEHGASAASS